MQSAGLPPDFHEGAADIYDRLEGFKPDTGDASSGLPEIEDIIASLVKR
jgi:hypothetical protein